jgi:hypothetical protein
MTMIPLLTKFRERANTRVPYTPLGVSDNYSTPSVPVPPQGTFQVPPRPGAGHGHTMGYAPQSHPPLPPYSHTDYVRQDYPTQPPPEPTRGRGINIQPKAEMQSFPVAPSAPPLQ